PVRDPLPTIHGGRKAGVFDPAAKSRRIALLVWRTIGMHRGQQGVVERDELWRSRSPTNGAFGELLEGSHEIGVLQQPKVMSHRLKRAAIRKLPLNLLERHNLGR